MRHALLIGFAAVSLCGCGLGGGAEGPTRKVGFWVETRTGDTSPTPMVTKLCLDAASAERMPVIGRGPRRAGACQKYAVTHDGNTYTVDSTCTFGGDGGPTITSHTVYSGDFNSSYTVKGQRTVSGSPDASRNGTHNFTMTAEFKGACPPEIQPGQVQLPSGDIVDIAQMRRFDQGGGGGGGGNRGGGPGGGPSSGNSAGNSTGGGNSTQ